MIIEVDIANSKEKPTIDTSKICLIKPYSDREINILFTGCEYSKDLYFSNSKKRDEELKDIIRCMEADSKINQNL